MLNKISNTENSNDTLKKCQWILFNTKQFKYLEMKKKTYYTVFH